MNNKWTKVYSTKHRYSAEIVRAVLLDHNIDSVILDKQDSAYVMLGEIEVYVHSEQSSLAFAIINSNDL